MFDKMFFSMEAKDAPMGSHEQGGDTESSSHHADNMKQSTKMP